MKADNSKIDSALIPREPETAGYQIITSAPYTFLALVDRAKDKSKWWSQDADGFMIFEKEDAARTQLTKLKYGNPCVVKYGKAVHRTSHWFWKMQESNLGKMIAEHEMIWHDDYWDEGTNMEY
ncbi:MAG: hypothetical protein LBJ72_08380 [Dysgonamonadaceae bacterium]|jgi:hypothetical protein|nr:hypothetical protein [Dysgonamonadaceae bacterium]